MTLRLIPLSQRLARDFVRMHHRHNRPPVGDIFRVGLAEDGVLVAVGIAGRPVARMADDGRTVEITRVCTQGHANACSRLYGALCRAAAALGYERAITYTREDEPGTSPKAAGFAPAGETVAQEWSRPSRPRRRDGSPIRKLRWERAL